MTEEKQKRINYNDVLEALTKDEEGNVLDEPLSPFDTNAGAIIKIIGYGSNSTAQKHLDAMRDDINKKRLNDAEKAETETPKPPKDLIENLWATAWMTAQVATLSRIEKLTIERDGLRAKSNAQSNDISGLAAQVDEQQDIIAVNTDTVERLKKENEIELTNVKSEMEVEINTVKIEIEDLKIKLEAAQKLIADANVETEQVKKDALHKEQLLQKETEIIKITMQSTIDHLNDQVSEMKAMRIATTNSEKS